MDRDGSSQPDIYSVIRSGLLEIASSQQPRISVTSPAASAESSRIRIKAEFRGEKFCIEMSRPVRFSDLENHMNSRYNLRLNIYYTLRNNELVVPVRNQLDLDRVIELFDRASTQRSLRLLLSRHQPDSGLPCTADSSLIPDASGTFTAIHSRILEVTEFRSFNR
ncbi:unnamed protein product [Gongylonema pulchrum]|uniref:PB1 domain-containing protein n=1 Tax=Gongylonema pulchrum TaxID=637853 RepID=A0A183DWG9_9BILA|nr:unnamed protein product [Gongylonema pulchrum]VDN34477.1 unnamed protein product [Gongylonema pulchrum]